MLSLNSAPTDFKIPFKPKHKPNETASFEDKLALKAHDLSLKSKFTTTEFKIKLGL